MIIEDEQSRTKLHRERVKREIKNLKRLNAPELIIENAEKKLIMTHTQYKLSLIHI